MNTEELTLLLHDLIPTSQLLDIKVTHADHNLVEVTGPLSINKNHFNSAFGGSLGTILILSCYSWLFKLLEDSTPNFHILVQEAQTKYLAPVYEDIKASCHGPDEEAIGKFLYQYKRKGVAAIKLKASVEIKDGVKACSFEGIFVATNKINPPVQH